MFILTKNLQKIQKSQFFLFFLSFFSNSVQFRAIFKYITFAFQQSGEGHLRFQGSEMHIPHHISESLETIFGLQIFKFFDEDPESFCPWIRESGCKN